MRHRVEGRKLKRTASHREALLRSLATQLFQHKRIRTTEAKAKETRRYAEAIITRAKRAHLAEQGGNIDVHARRMVARDIQDPAVVQELFNEIAPKVATRPGGYTRVVKLAPRLGDGARLAIIELVDFNTERDESAVRSRTKRTISRAERVARSRARQNEKEATSSAPAAEEQEPMAAAADDAIPMEGPAPEGEEIRDTPQAEAIADAEEAQQEQKIEERDNAEGAEPPKQD